MKEFFSILKRTDSSAFRARVCLFFLTKKGCCGIKVYICNERLIIVISSEKGYRLLSYVCPQRKLYTLRENFLSDIEV